MLQNLKNIKPFYFRTEIQTHKEFEVKNGKWKMRKVGKFYRNLLGKRKFHAVDDLQSEKIVKLTW